MAEAAAQQVGSGMGVGVGDTARGSRVCPAFWGGTSPSMPIGYRTPANRSGAGPPGRVPGTFFQARRQRGSTEKGQTLQPANIRREFRIYFLLGLHGN